MHTNCHLAFNSRNAAHLELYYEWLPNPCDSSRLLNRYRLTQQHLYHLNQMLCVRL